MTTAPTKPAIAKAAAAKPAASGPPSWVVALLNAIGAPVNSVTTTALQLWQQSEGTPAAGNNPLAITDPSGLFPHSGVIASNGGDPVYAFPTEQVGASATAHFLENGYGSVIDALRAGTSLPAIYGAINGSTWCKGCQSGKYPVALAAAVSGSPSVGGAAGATAGGTGAGTGKPDLGSIDATGGGVIKDTITGPVTSAIDSVLSAVVKTIGQVALYLVFLLGGAALVVMGILRMTNAEEKAQEAVKEIGPVVAAAA